MKTPTVFSCILELQKQDIDLKWIKGQTITSKILSKILKVYPENQLKLWNIWTEEERVNQF